MIQNLSHQSQVLPRLIMAPKRRRPARMEDNEEVHPVDEVGEQHEVEIDTEPAERPQTGRREVMTNIARRRAAHFAHFKDEDEEEGDNVHVGSNEARTLGPWSSAVELVNARSKAQAAREDKILQKGKEMQDIEDVQWVPTRDLELGPRAACPVPPLLELCTDLLVEYIDAVESLWGVPDAIKVRLAAAVCIKRKMSPQAAMLFSESLPGEVVLPNCTQLTGEDMTSIMRGCLSDRLERLELGFCGRGFGDDTAELIGRGPVLPLMTSLMLSGAYRLSDEAVHVMVGKTPGLRQLSLAEGSRLNGTCLMELPSLTPLLSSLNLQRCRGVPAEVLGMVVPQLAQLKSLNLREIPEVDDKLLAVLAQAPSLRDLNLGKCAAVTDKGLDLLVTGRPELEGLCIDECGKLTDKTLMSIAGSLKSLRHFSARHNNKFSDAAMAAVVANGTLHHLCVSRCDNIGPLTMQQLALTCKDSLQELDVSFCRKIPEKMLGLVADRCTQLKRLDIFGCSHITNLVIHGHCNENLVHIYGLGSDCYK